MKTMTLARVSEKERLATCAMLSVSVMARNLP